jgi:hypothetical protein
MNKFILAIILSVFIIPLSGCTTNYSSVTQVEDSGFILLKGNFNNTTLYVDDNEITIDLSVSQYMLDEQMVSKFPISVGVHSIKVMRDETTLVRKKILLSNGQTVEILVP